MTRLIVTKEAEQDVSNILVYLEGQAGAIVAEEYGEAVRRTLIRLAQFPDTGAPRPELGPNVRVTTLYPFLLIYEHAADAPEFVLLRVLHGASNVTAEILMR